MDEEENIQNTKIKIKDNYSRRYRQHDSFSIGPTNYFDEYDPDKKWKSEVIQDSLLTQMQLDIYRPNLISSGIQSEHDAVIKNRLFSASSPEKSNDVRSRCHATSENGDNMIE